MNDFPILQNIAASLEEESTKSSHFDATRADTLVYGLAAPRDYAISSLKKEYRF